MANGTGRFRRWTDRNFIAISSSLLILLLLLPYLATRMVVTIPAGHGGALWLRFFGGTVINFQFGEGTKIIPPWDKIYVYDLRVRQETDRFDVLTREGLQISAEVTIRFRLKPDSLGAITAFAGPEFVKSLLMPSVGATARLETAKYTLEEIYSTKRHQIEEEVHARITTTVDHLIPDDLHPGSEVDVQDFWFRSIILPDALRTAIEGKLAQAQFAEQYKFILLREEQEKQRKLIEAQGIKAFQDTVSNGISENYLRWKGIDATLKLADSPNSKIVIIGGKEGLPVILGPLDGGSTGAQPTPPATGAAQSAPLAPSTAVTPSSISGGNAGAKPSSLTTGASSQLPADPTASNPALSMPPKPTQGH
jgi:prohibitin 2